MKAFVTGGTGFVGAHLVRALLERGDEVRCLVRDPAKAGALGWSSAVELVRGDLDDARALREGCAGAEVVYHVAGRVSAPSPAAFMAANRDGTARVLEAAAVERPRRLLYVSSLAAAGPTLPGQPIDESRPPAPVTPYGRSKLAAELLVRATPVPWTIVRPPTVYGERDRELFKLFKLARAAVVPVFGDGSQELSVIYAADLADAVIAAATAQGSVGAVYYAAHPSVTTSRELVRAIARAVGGRGDRVGRRGGRGGRGGARREPRILPLPAPLARILLWTVGSLAHLAGRDTILSADKAPEFLAPAWTCRPDALIRDTGWRAKVDLETGLRRTADWYRREGWL